MTEVDPNQFEGSDTERINLAIRSAAEEGLPVVIPKRNLHPDGSRDKWILDSAILLHANSRLLLEGCHIQLSNRCRDNFFRTANFIPEGQEIALLENITISGTGGAILEGADIPRATGDSSKQLGKDTFGSDAGVDTECQFGDWRNYGIHFVNVRGFLIEGIEIRDSHSWAITLQSCSQGTVRDIRFCSTGRKNVNGSLERILNQDGLDLRRGCRDILIENIQGYTGDDLIALTALPPKSTLPGDDSTQWDIRHVIIRNIRGYSHGGHAIIRLLNAPGIGLHDVIIDGVIDSSVPPNRSKRTIRIGDSNAKYGGVPNIGETSRIVINNIVSRSNDTILIQGSLADSTISNVIAYDSKAPAVALEIGEEYLRNVSMVNIVVSPASKVDV